MTCFLGPTKRKHTNANSQKIGKPLPHARVGDHDAPDIVDGGAAISALTPQFEVVGVEHEEASVLQTDPEQLSVRAHVHRARRPDPRALHHLLQSANNTTEFFTGNVSKFRVRSSRILFIIGVISLLRRSPWRF